MLVDSPTLFLIQVSCIKRGKFLEDNLDSLLDGRPGLLFLPPIQHQAFRFEGIQQFMRHLLDSFSLRAIEFEIETGEQVE